MRNTIKTLICLLLVSSGANASLGGHDHVTSDHLEESQYSGVLSEDAPLIPLTEAQIASVIFEGLNVASRFPKTLWSECSQKNFKGNYVGLNCTKREIAKIFLKFLDKNFKNCATRAADSRGVELKSFKVVHAGIKGDRSHNPRSLHKQFRAMDIKDVLITDKNNKTFQFNYKENGRGRFYNELRACWGRAIIDQNDCPPHYRGINFTGTIGKDDDPYNKHHRHLHMSLPYCVAGNYAGNLFRR